MLCVIWALKVVCINSFPEGREKLLPFLKGRKIPGPMHLYFHALARNCLHQKEHSPKSPHWPVSSSELLEENHTSSWWKIRCWRRQQASPTSFIFLSTLKKWYKDRGQHNIIKQLLSNRRKKSEEKNDPREFARVMSCDPNAHKTPTHILVPSTASQMLNFTAFPRRESCTGHPQLAAEVWDAHLFIRRQKFHFLGSLILEWEWSSPIWCKSLAFFFFFFSWLLIIPVYKKLPL